VATIGDKYTPTPAEEKLILQLLDPSSIGKSITEVCEAAEVVRDVYYDAKKKPEFVAYFKELSKSLITDQVAPIVNSLIKEAIGGSFQHQKLALEMAGMHTDTQNIDHTSTDGSMTPKGFNDFYDTSKP